MNILVQSMSQHVNSKEACVTNLTNLDKSKKVFPAKRRVTKATAQNKQFVVQERSFHTTRATQETARRKLKTEQQKKKESKKTMSPLKNIGKSKRTLTKEINPARQLETADKNKMSRKSTKHWRGNKTAVQTGRPAISKSSTRNGGASGKINVSAVAKAKTNLDKSKKVFPAKRRVTKATAQNKQFGVPKMNKQGVQKKYDASSCNVSESPGRLPTAEPVQASSADCELDRDPCISCIFCSFKTYSTEHLELHTLRTHPGMLAKSFARMITKQDSRDVRTDDALFYWSSSNRRPSDVEKSSSPIVIDLMDNTDEDVKLEIQSEQTGLMDDNNHTDRTAGETVENTSAPANAEASSRTPRAETLDSPTCPNSSDYMENLKCHTGQLPVDAAVATYNSTVQMDNFSRNSPAGGRSLQSVQNYSAALYSHIQRHYSQPSPATSLVTSYPDTPQATVGSLVTSYPDTPQATVGSLVTRYPDTPQATVGSLGTSYPDTPQATVSFLGTSYPDTPQATVSFLGTSYPDTPQATVSFLGTSYPDTPQATVSFLGTSYPDTPQATVGWQTSQAHPTSLVSVPGQSEYNYSSAFATQNLEMNNVSRMQNSPSFHSLNQSRSDSFSVGQNSEKNHNFKPAVSHSFAPSPGHVSQTSGNGSYLHVNVNPSFPGQPSNTSADYVSNVRIASDGMTHSNPMPGNVSYGQHNPVSSVLNTTNIDQSWFDTQALPKMEDLSGLYTILPSDNRTNIDQSWFDTQALPKMEDLYGLYSNLLSGEFERDGQMQQITDNKFIQTPQAPACPPLYHPKAASSTQSQVVVTKWPAVMSQCQPAPYQPLQNERSRFLQPAVDSSQLPGCGNQFAFPVPPRHIHVPASGAHSYMNQRLSVLGSRGFSRGPRMSSERGRMLTLQMPNDQVITGTPSKNQQLHQQPGRRGTYCGVSNPPSQSRNLVLPVQNQHRSQNPAPRMPYPVAPLPPQTVKRFATHKYVKDLASVFKDEGGDDDIQTVAVTPGKDEPQAGVASNSFFCRCVQCRKDQAL